MESRVRRRVRLSYNEASHDLLTARERIRANSQNEKTNNDASAWFIIFQSGEGRNTQMGKKRENGGERVMYTQVQGSMNKDAMRNVSRGGNESKGQECVGVLLATHW